MKQFTFSELFQNEHRVLERERLKVFPDTFTNSWARLGEYTVSIIHGAWVQQQSWQQCHEGCYFNISFFCQYRTVGVCLSLCLCCPLIRVASCKLVSMHSAVCTDDWSKHGTTVECVCVREWGHCEKECMRKYVVCLYVRVSQNVFIYIGIWTIMCSNIHA